jgi:hypothetical protein
VKNGEIPFIYSRVKFQEIIEILITVVAGRGKISEPITTETSKLDWSCFEYY